MIPFSQIERIPYFGVGISKTDYPAQSPTGYKYNCKKYYWCMSKGVKDLVNLFEGEPEILGYWIYDLSCGEVNQYGTKCFLPVDSGERALEITDHRIEELVNDNFNTQLQ